jgi:60 kDa SS-A/Ro ribonucleoprotein
LDTTRRLSGLLGGGTNCSAPLARLNREKAAGDFVLYVSDNQSWVDATDARCTSMMQEWGQFRRRNPRAKLACLNLQPYGTVQASGTSDILNISGFSDQVFQALSDFASGCDAENLLVSRIEAVVL